MSSCWHRLRWAPVALAGGLLTALGTVQGAVAHVRGSDGQGHTDPAAFQLPWPSSGPSILWRRRVGDGYSGIVVAEERVFSQAQTLAGQFVVCLDLATGAERWRTRCNWPWQPEGDWPGPYGSPTYVDGKVYAADCYGVVRCLDARNGRSFWQTDLAQMLGVEMPGFGYAATPLVELDKVFLPVGGQGSAVVALGAQDGQLLWRSGDGNAGYSSCVLLEAQGYPHVVTFLEHSALGLDPATGRQLWQREWPGEYNPHATWPLYRDPYLFYARPFRRGSEVLQLTRQADGVRAEPVWTSEVISLDILSGVRVDGFVYGFDVRDAQTRTQGATQGNFKCVELATGVERWSSDRPGHASALACGDRLVLLSESGQLILVAANSERYEELARWPLFPGRRCWTAPVLHDGLLVARSREEFVCVSLAKPNQEFAPTTKPQQGGGDRSLGNDFAGWFSRHYTAAFHSPSWADHARWYLVTLVGVLLPAGWLAGMLGRDARSTRLLFLLGAGVLGIAGPWMLTWITGRFVFTWPAAVFLAVGAVLHCRAWALRKPSVRRRLLARVALAGLAAGLVGYVLLCRSLFLPAGYAFLAGLLPALPLMVGGAAASSEGMLPGRSGVMALAGFTVYFWASALFLAWRTGVW